MSTMLIHIILELHIYFNDEKKVNKWLTKPNMMLGDTPANLINDGRGELVLVYIKEKNR
jgi:uncharacterized protein (DUF2384 family)